MKNREELLADVRNKLSTFKNLLEMLEESKMIYYAEPMLFNLIKLEI